MASEDMGMVPNHRRDNNSLNPNPQILFHDQNPLRFSSHRHPSPNPDPDPDPKTRELGGFMDDKLFALDHRARYFSGRGPGSTPSSGEEEEDEGEEEREEDEDDDDDEDENDNENENEGLVGIERGGEGGKVSGGGGGIGDKVELGNSKHFSFGSSTRQTIREGSLLPPGADVNRVSSSENGHQGKGWHFQKMVTVAEHDGYMYYSQLQGVEASNQGRKDIIPVDNGCGFSGRKESSVTCDHGESLRAIFSDPITGALMDDAMILPCGHSFGHGGIEQVIKMKACYSCSHPVSEDLVAPNLSLRAAVQAFLREEDMLMYRASKRRRERFEQDQGNYGDSSFSEVPRGRGVQFPFSVTDRVIIKGNKRTPQRFVGREAIVTTQCLNGWYVVKTLDNAESVKLQYRSLEKVGNNPCSKPMSITNNKMAPNWLQSA